MDDVTTTPPEVAATRPTEDTLLEDLTEPQIEAVTHVDGPLLVLAGPGSGKTRVITRRVAHLVLGVGIPPWNVLAITFTNKAAGEMQQRVASLVSARQARAITVCTFHSLCARVLRQYAERLGLPPGFSIYDTADQQRAIKQALEDLEINPKNFTPGNMLSSISSSKNELIGPEEFAANYANDFHSRTVAKVYKKYDAILTRNHAMDFDDLLLKTVHLFRDHPGVLEELQDRWQYVLIDEYQDTNHAQFMLASALANKYKNICATGDPDQSIYGWRGANIRNILEFESHYPDAKVVRLEQNYRSTQHILTAADTLIRNNKRRKHKELFTTLGEGEKVKVLTCRNAEHEAKMVVEQFQDLHEQDGVAWGGMAVFYRMNSLSRVMEDALRDAGIPYQIARGTAFYERAEIKNTVAYLRSIVNPADEVSLFRIINMPTRGISDKSVKAMQAFALANNTPVVRVIDEPMRLTSLTTRAQTAVARFAKMLHDWRRAAGFAEGDPSTGLIAEATSGGEPSLRAFVERVMRESGLEEHYRTDKSDPDQERLANLGEFITFTQQFEDEYIFERESESEDGATPSLAEKLLAFLERISLISDVDAVDSETGAVTLMTLHAAKGLEYHAVAVIGVEDGLLPHERSRNDEHELEEERRLCFVGITRAMRRLYLCHARYRTIFGQTMPTIASRFLRELPEEVVETADLTDEGDADFEVDDESRHQRSLAHKQAGQYPPGTLVRHPQFGLGRVVQVSAMGMHTRAKVNFNAAGPKTLILQYARLEVVEA